MDSETRYLIALTKVSGVGAITAKLLTAYCGSTEAVFKESPKALKAIPGIGDVVIRGLSEAEPEALFETEYHFIHEHDIQVIPYWEEQYPFRLKPLADSPLLLFSKGNPELNQRRILSVVGTRKCTHYGRRMTESIIKGLKSYDVMIVSGLAYGIDAEAHQAALASDMSTVAVVAHGLDTLYPAIHRKMAEKISEQGGVITEFPSGVLPQKERFPMRNRIIAGLCDVLLVVETAKSGGSMISVQYATDYDRQVVALPGRVEDPMSAGTNYLIAKEIAQLIRSSEDIARAMHWPSQKKGTGTQIELFPQLSMDEKEVYDIMTRGEEIPMEQLLEQSTFSLGKLASVLLQLEMKGVIGSCPGTRYVKY